MRESATPRVTTFASALRLWLGMLVVGAAVLLGSVLVGGGDSSLAASWQALVSSADTPMHAIVWELRFPRSVAAYGVGGLLAVSGCLMQILVRNPLADPYTLGLSGGAAVGALGSMLAGAGRWRPPWCVGRRTACLRRRLPPGASRSPGADTRGAA